MEAGLSNPGGKKGPRNVLTLEQASAALPSYPMISPSAMPQMMYAPYGMMYPDYSGAAGMAAPGSAAAAGAQQYGQAGAYAATGYPPGYGY